MADRDEPGPDATPVRLAFRRARVAAARLFGWKTLSFLLLLAFLLLFFQARTLSPIGRLTPQKTRKLLNAMAGIHAVAQPRRQFLAKARQRAMPLGKG